MHIVMAGGSGFVGNALQKYLLENGHEVTILTRNLEGVKVLEGVKKVEWLNHGNRPEAELVKVDAIVNLAGESIRGMRWTSSKKTKIIESRLNAVREINRIIQTLKEKPQVLIQASAVGYYGMSETDVFTEERKSEANDFLASVVQQWEHETLKISRIRTVLARFGVVLGSGGALPFMALPYKLGIGGTIGSGKQWLSWVHIEDAIRMIEFAITHSIIEGPMNITAPKAVTFKEFGQTLSRVLQRSHWLPVPEFIVKLAMGEMSEMLLKGQHVRPEVALSQNYYFHFPDLHDALTDILRKKLE